MLNLKNIARLSLVCLIMSLAFFVGSANAAEVLLFSKNHELAPKQSFVVDFFINSPNESLNAMEGTINYPKDLLTLEEINDGGSPITFWITRPNSEMAGKISFSGIIPGGDQVSGAKIFSVIFSGRKEGIGQISFGDLKVLKNDGAGTPADLNIVNFDFNINAAVTTTPAVIAKAEDTIGPESFSPVVSSDPSVFGGQKFLVFMAQDKGLGIDHYEVKETDNSRLGRFFWTKAESPYLLKNQALDKYIFVKAVDKAGNATVAMIIPTQTPKWYNTINWWLFLSPILLGVLCLFGFVWKKYHTPKK